MPKVSDHAEVHIPRRAPAVHGNDHALCVLARIPVTDKAKSVSASDLNFLDILLKKYFSRFVDALLESLNTITLRQLRSLLFK